MGAMDKLRASRAVRATLAAVMAVALALPTSALTSLGAEGGGVAPQEAHAAAPSTFTGSAYIEVTNKAAAYYGTQAQCKATLTLPDGSKQVAYGHCISGDAYGYPVDGTYRYTATQQSDGSYSVVVWTSAGAAANPGAFVPGTMLGTQNMGGIKLWYNPTGDLELTKKSSNESITAGNACYSLEGAVYTVYKDYACTSQAATLTTNADGYAKATGLEAGTYYVKETTAATGYALDGSVYTVTVQGGQTAKVDGGTVYDVPLNDPGNVQLAKVDAEGHAYKSTDLPLGSATLEGAQFTVKYYANMGGDASGEPTRTWVYETGSLGKIRFNSPSQAVAGDNLYYQNGLVIYPIGTYVIQETKAPEGYLTPDELNEALAASPIVVSKPGDFSNQLADIVGDYAEQEGTAEVYVSEQVKRGDVEFSKKSDSGMRLSNVAFMVTSTATGESHVVVTDANGKFDSSAAYSKHTESTNGNDAAVTKGADGSYTVDDSKLSSDYGVWFGSDAEGNAVPADDSKGAFPYDTYTIAELRCAANEGLDLIPEQTFTVSKDGYQIDLGTFDDTQIELTTSATDKVDSDKVIVADSDAAVSDAVTYHQAVKGRAYTLESTLADVTDGGKELTTAATEFTAGQTSGTVNVELAFDASGLAGHVLAVKTAVKYQGSVLFEHNADYSDVSEQVTVVGTAIGTVALDGESGTHNVAADPEAHVTDTVTYSNAIPGQLYTLVGKAMLKNADGTAAELLDAEGNPVTSQIVFTAEKADGEVEVPFTFDASGFAEATQVVFYEYLYKGEPLEKDPVTSHEDPSDGSQTVTVTPPEIGTTATDGADGDKVVAANSTVKVVDSVEYTGLTPGKEYTVTGTLMLKTTEHKWVAFVDHEQFGEGHDVETNSKGTYFKYDTDDKGGYKSLKMNGNGTWTLTTVTFGEGVNEDGTPNAKSNLTYETLQAGDVEVGDDGSGEVIQTELTDANGDKVTASATFTPDTAHGFVDVEFEFDGSNLEQGQEIVAFESLARDGVELAVHADINDEPQTVTVASPEIGTTAADSLDGDKVIVADEQAGVTDTVAYENLSAESEYTMIGVLMDKSTGLPLVTGEGWDAISQDDLKAFWDDVLAALGTTEKKLANEKAEDFEASDVDWAAFQEALAKNAAIAAAISYEQAEFSPQHADGSIDVALPFDGSRFIQADSAAEVVAFEFLLHDGKLVTAHADLGDGGQTVTVEPSSIGTELTDSTDGDHAALTSKTLKLVDKVSYENLIPGKEYVMTGKLMVKDSGKALLSGDQEVTAKKAFTPNNPSGEVEIEFEFDASALDGKSLVAFESCTKDGVEVAVHADIDDAAQTVKIDKLGGAEGKTYSKTGVDFTAYLWLVALIGAAGASMAAFGGYRVARARKAEAAQGRKFE